ncbi:D-Ala-D-Ala carboxypeptidase family metallohydrolase [Micromonospora sp. NPDC049559]|uniref:D-Ala-D-Ala carboxypeptidase family metallohydrolase n=1 Tax=Micromonospora sp. NPDC049559 TaxID=3155923 RepID=UPI00343ED440
MAVPRLSRAALALLTMLAATVLAAVVQAPAAHADGCYTWGRTLGQGTSGEDVRQLQIRVAGWPGYRNYVLVDGIYGPGTAAAVQRFQAAYGLAADGVAGPQTFTKIYELQDDDCTPIHFDYTELDDDCVGGWSGGAISATATKANALRVMWKLEALRRALGDQPLVVTTAFRNTSCNASVGGASNSQHLYGTAADLVSSSATLCRIAQEARYHGFSGLYGPGYPDHDDHVHVDSRIENDADGITNSWSWSAPNCGVAASGALSVRTETV